VRRQVPEQDDFAAVDLDELDVVDNARRRPAAPVYDRRA